MRITVKLLLTFMAVFIFADCRKGETSQRASSNGESTGRQGVTSSPGPAEGQTVSVNPTSVTAQAKPKTDVCTLLTNQEIEAVQRETVKETKLSGSSQSGFTVSQCFFTLPTFSNSISLQLTQKGEGAGARDPKEFWRDTFHEERQKVNEREKDGARAGKKEEEEKSAPPQKVNGVGDEAFWMGSRVGGALYVLKGSNYLRISIGGAGDSSEKIRKSKTLAQKVIARL